MIGSIPVKPLQCAAGVYTPQSLASRAVHATVAPLCTPSAILILELDSIRRSFNKSRMLLHAEEPSRNWHRANGVGKH